MRLKLLVIIVLSGWTTITGGQEDYLALLTEDFQSLARITNAIYLRTSQIQNTVKFNDVIAELFVIDPKDLIEMRSIDTDSAISDLERITKDREFKDSVKYDSEAEFEKRMDSLKEMLTSDVELDPDVTMSYVNVAREEVESSIPSVGKRCKDFEAFYNMTVTYQKTEEELATSPTEKDLEPFEKSLKRFASECFDGAKDFKTSFEKKTLTFLKYQLIRSLPDFIDSLQFLSTTISSLKDDLEKSRPVWENREPSHLGEKIEKLYNTYTRRFNVPVPLPILTVSFHDPTDLLEVPSDLQTQFFSKFFVKESTKELREVVKFLDPFMEISREFLKVHSLWTSFGKQDDGSDGMKILQFVPKKIGEFEKNLEGSEGYMKIVEAALVVADECVTPPSTEFEEISKQLRNQDPDLDMFMNTTFIRLESRINAAVGESATVNGTSTNIYQDCLKKTQEKFNELKDANPKNEPFSILHGATIHFEECTKSLKLYELLEKFKDLNSTVQEVQNAPAPAASTTTVELKDVIEKSNASEVISCLKSKNIEYKNLPQVSKFVTTFKNMPNANQFNTATKFMKQLKEIKKALDQLDAQTKTSPKRHRREVIDQIMTLKETKTYAENIGVCTRALSDLGVVLEKKSKLMTIEPFDAEVQEVMDKDPSLKSYMDPTTDIQRLVFDAMEIQKTAERLVNSSDLVVMAGIFELVSKLRGIDGNPMHLKPLLETFKNNATVTKSMQLLMDTQLNFVTYESRLKDGPHTVVLIRDYFDKVFGHAPAGATIIQQITEADWPLIGSTSFFGMIIVALVVVALFTVRTKAQRQKLIEWWWYYKQNPKKFAERWRYSGFADNNENNSETIEKNLLINCCREGNALTLMEQIKRGAYINAYSSFGNTGLHLAVKESFPKCVELLIMNGADRTMLNTRNYIPEQMIPPDLSIVQREDRAEGFREIKKIFDRHRNKTYKKRLPVIFPSFRFHIFIDEMIADDVTARFMTAFRDIVSDPTVETTHFIAKCNADGVFETDDPTNLFWVFYGPIIVKESWMEACLADKTQLELDSKYLVDTIKYKGQSFNTVKKWSEARAMGAMEYLHRVFAFVVLDNYPYYDMLRAMLWQNGARLWEDLSDEERRDFRKEARPYLHADLGSFIVIYDAKADLKPFSADIGYVYTYFTVDQFIAFMLKREVCIDARIKPIQALPSDDLIQD